MTFDSTADTQEHIGKVQKRMQEVISSLTIRASEHDRSKLQEPEKSAYDRLMEFKSTHDMTYGSPEYAEGLKILGPALDHHYAHNSHHPQHRSNGIDGMSLLDALEMLADWRAAGERYKGGNIRQSLTHNRERFGISDQFYSILENTVKELGWWWAVDDRVFVTADNYGSPATIIEVRESEGAPVSHYKVRTDTGDEFWALDYEISDEEA